MKFHMYECPCCSYLTLAEKPPGTFEFCPVCNWEDDDVQASDPTHEGGANGISLVQARNNFARFGAISKDAISRVRKALPEEIPR
jgi:Cysteine-rich CPCC